MNPKVKQMWVGALRSGTYEQTKGTLTDGKGYCCLGVLCDLARKAGVGKWEIGKDDAWRMDDYAGNLPPVVQEWAGLEANPVLMDEPCGCGTSGCTSKTRATVVNDELNWSFEQIADAVEANL